ncbi:cupin-like domain-containing protein [Scytonema sp. NUACC26]|uniref:cupin-like domain-containing protein n=1 Tax=Scytonema sp. NUACC26 TaxID=3140176 RepID=UPI0034DC0589
MVVKNSDSILKITNPSRKKFVELWKQYQPFLIDSVAENWNACKNWSNDYLIKKCGNHTIRVLCYAENYLNNYQYVYDKTYPDTFMKFKEYVDIKFSEKKTENSLRYYMCAVDLEKFFPELTVDINYPEYFSRKPKINFWFGSCGNTTTLHFDREHNILAQIRGRKRILLYPPSNYLSFYPPNGERGALEYCSKVDPLNSNLELFPKFPWQQKKEIILQAGEMLYIPPFWWHHVTGVDENISLSFWYDINIGDWFRQKRIFSIILNILHHSKTVLFTHDGS